MGSTVKSIRVREELWERLHRLSREESKPLTQLLNEALEKYLAEKSGRKAAEKVRNLPVLSLGGEPVTREEIYEDRD
ncbi:MAG: hypothetical protein DRI91_06580 [Aquificota bacterium]|nr:MAG: hypothetical protein DRI91_06580 [Aquificota bacterium]